MVTLYCGTLPMKKFLLFSLLFVAIAFFADFLMAPSIRATVTGDPIRGVSGDLWADVILGQPDFGEGMMKERVATRGSLPGGVHIDTTTTPNRMYVYDSGNSRILAYGSLGVCGNSSATTCTSNSDCGAQNTCVLNPNKAADFFVGQASVSGGSCNRDANMLHYPYIATPSASSICTMETDEISPGEAGSYSTMDTDQDGNLYLADWQNNRVLRYNDIFDTNNTVADDVWGQSNFTSPYCNQGSSSNPTASTLCFSRFNATATQVGGHDSFSSAVAFDPEGNMWVADVMNNRVVRFPKKNGVIQKTADAVLGQSTYTTRNSGNGLNQLKNPEAVAVATDGAVFVVDGLENNRILKFSAPISDGQTGQVWGSGFNGATSMEIDPQGQGIWVSDNRNHMIELWNFAGTQVLKVLYKDTYAGTWPPTATCNNSVGYCWMQDTRGSIGITTSGDVWVSGSNNYQNVIRFKGPIPTPQAGVLVQPDAKLFNAPHDPGSNFLSGRSFGSPRGVVASNNQLIVADEKRLMFWSNPTTITNWQTASGFVGVPDGFSKNPKSYGRIVADAANHLFVTHDDRIEIYNLPLTSSSYPAASMSAQLQDLEGHAINLLANGALNTGGLSATSNGSHLWVALPDSSRVIRIKNPLTSPVVDVVLGQLDYLGTACNMGEPANPPSSFNERKLCNAGSVSLDSQNNVHVSDSSLEARGNKRLMVWSANNFPTNTAQTIYATPANNIVLSDAGPLQIAFDANDRGVVGYNPYQLVPSVNPKRSLNILTDLLTVDSTLIFDEFNDYYVFPYAADFDSNGNLYVVDMNRFRILMYKLPFASSGSE